MAIGWFIVPFVTVETSETYPLPYRYPAVVDVAGVERWSAAECLGNRCVCKVRGTLAVLQTLAAMPGVKRLPKDRLDDSLSDLSAAARKAVRDELLDQGYTAEEITTRFGDDLGAYTLRQVVRFMLTRRREARRNNNTITLDGPEVGCRPVDDVDGEV